MNRNEWSAEYRFQIDLGLNKRNKIVRITNLNATYIIKPHIFFISPEPSSASLSVGMRKNYENVP